MFCVTISLYIVINLLSIIPTIWEKIYCVKMALYIVFIISPFQAARWSLGQLQTMAWWTERLEIGSHLGDLASHPTNAISIKFEIRSKFECYSLKHAQPITKKFCTCHNSDMCKILLWSVEYILNQSTSNFGLIFLFDRNIVSGPDT